MAKISIMLATVMLTLLAQADTGILDSCYIPMVCDSGQASWISYDSYKEMQVKTSCEKKIKKIHDEFLTNVKDLIKQYKQLQVILNEKTKLKESTTPLTNSQGTAGTTTAIATTKITSAIVTTGTTTPIATTGTMTTIAATGTTAPIPTTGTTATITATGSTAVISTPGTTATIAAIETTASIATTGTTTVISTTPCNGGNGLTSGSKCFWIAKLTSTVTYSQTISVCEKDGGLPANIYDQSQYNAVMNYIRTNIPPSHTGQYALWTGMKYDVTNNVASLSNGMKAPFVKWYGDNRTPYNRAAWSQIGINVDRVVTELKQGMLNGDPVWGKHAALCSQDIISG